jgi:hypothetical protein
MALRWRSFLGEFTAVVCIPYAWSWYLDPENGGSIFLWNIITPKG